MKIKDLLDLIAIDLCPDPEAEVFINAGEGEFHEIFDADLDMDGNVIFNFSEGTA